ncbi:MAG TPA: OmpA family protein [Polyangia bacterium]|nr:OmpA family protein [Polyangia bacterium]
MAHLLTIALAGLPLIVHAAPPDAGAFQLHDSAGGAKESHGVHASKLEPTKDDAAMKFFVVDTNKGPVKGVVVELSSETGTKYYTDETDAEGYAETLVPNGSKYELTYLSLGKKDVAATVTVEKKPKQTIKLTLRWKPRPAPIPFVLTGIVFDTNKAYIRPESYPRLDIVADFMTHKKSARVEISGHTDNVGKPKANKALSQNRAESCRKYIISKGVDGSRIKAVGYGDERPIVPNDSDENRQKNRRIEVVEIPDVQ